MSTGIFLLQNDNSLIEMNQEEYVTENIFQELLEKYPNLLAGDQIDERNPRKWLLVSREVSIPDKEESNGRWSVDHVFLDQDGIPTLVEVKRSSDTRIRREVVGQLLEYAANATNYWSVEKIRRDFEEHCKTNNANPDDVINDTFNMDNIEEYWENVESNLEDGKLRLLFVADEIPFELKTLVEFLNEKMEKIEVLALEIKQYVGGDKKTLVPRVIGQTSKSLILKSGSRESKQWDEKSFMIDLERRMGKDAVKVVESLLNWSTSKGLNNRWGKGKQDGSLFPILQHSGTEYYTFSCWTYGRIEIQFQRISTCKPFDSLEKRKRMMNELNKISGINITDDKLEVRPSISYEILMDETSLKIFLEIWNEYISDIKRYNKVNKG